MTLINKIAFLIFSWVKMERFVIYIFLVIMAVQASRRKRPWDFKGTVPGIREIVLGRCYTYLELSSTNRKQSLTVNVDCKILWQKFRRAWANKDPCNVTEKSYQDFISLMDSKKTTKDQVMNFEFCKYSFSLFCSLNFFRFKLNLIISKRRF